MSAPRGPRSPSVDGAPARTVCHSDGVVADSVNPLAITRSTWRKVAADAGVASAEIEVICSDPDEHRRRVDSRGLQHQTRRVPPWQQVREREYEPWQTQRLVIDTAG